MSSTPPDGGDRTVGPLAGLRWALESPDDHWARHDREQVSPLQIDILLQISGIDYPAATSDAVDGQWPAQDLADVDLLTSDDPGR